MPLMIVSPVSGSELTRKVGSSFEKRRSAFDMLVSDFASVGLIEYEITGVPTTIPFHLRLLENPTFLRGGVYTNYLAEHMAEFTGKA